MRMLTFEEKLTIIDTFSELERHEVSLGRVNYHYEDSVYDKKVIVYHLHPNGNGFVFAEMIEEKDYPVDKKGMVNIRDFSEEKLRTVIQQSIESLSESDPHEENWKDKENNKLVLVNDYDTWNVYAGELLDASFATYNSAVDYLQQEGFKRIE